VSFQERLEKISATIKELHQAAGEGPRTRQLIDSLFRDVHSFKAAASAEGLHDLTHIAHEFENLLHSLRTGKINLDDEVLRACDDTAAALSGDTESFSSDRLHKLTQLRPGAESVAMQARANLYEMEAVFDPADFDDRFRLLKSELEKIAEIISTSARMEDGRIKFRIVYAARSEKIRVQKILEQAAVAGKALATTLGKEIEFVVEGEELLLEQSVSDALTDALLHLVRNAVDHGIASRGTVRIEAEANHITVTDDGRGIDPANIQRMFEPGFSTANEITEISGRGVGLDAVKHAVEDLGGNVEVTSEPGKGSSFKIKLPNPSSDA
jgi:two-component system, chemotaxis family, sensor kinase CheA